MTESKPKIGGLLLAAGSSRRMGSPKQLLQFEGKTLIRRAAEALVDAGCEPVVVVLGAEIERSRIEIADLPVKVIENAEWESGMGSSIEAGISQIAAHNIDAVMITLCDLPYVNAQRLELFLKTFSQNRSRLIAAEYNGIRGVPALFPRELFASLQGLNGDKGARELIRNSPDAVTIPLPEAAIDIDIDAELDQLRIGNKPK